MKRIQEKEINVLVKPMSYESRVISVFLESSHFSKDS